MQWFRSLQSLDLPGRASGSWFAAVILGAALLLVWPFGEIGRADTGAADAGSPAADTAGTNHRSATTDPAAEKTDAGAPRGSEDASSGASGGNAPGASGSGGSNPESHSLESYKSGEGPGLFHRILSFFGIFALLAVALALSTNRSEVDWELVAWGVGLQLVFGVLIFYAPVVHHVFDYAGAAVSKLIDFTDAGSEFLFDFGNPMDGQWERSAQNFAFSILPTIIFFSTLMTILYYLGVMQAVVKAFALLMRKTMGISGAESLSVSANIFVGQTEAPLVIKPYVEDMTVSELAVVMTGGFATVAGGVMAAYVGMLEAQFPDIGKHLITASVMSAPAALVVAKIMYPETGEPETMGDVEMNFETKDENVIGAAARGASEGLELALNVGAMLLAFLALIALANYLVAWPGMQWNLGVLEELIAFYQNRGMPVPEGCTMQAVGTEAETIRDCAKQMAAAQGAPEHWLAPAISLEKLFGYVFWPFALIMGVPVDDCFYVGQLMGEKMILNEFVAYASLAEMLNSGVELQRRSVIIATYALCGFANFSSIGIQLGGIGGIAPSRKDDLSRLALRAMFGGTIAAMMTATVAGVLVP